MTKFKDLEEDKNEDGVYKCPNCGEFELREVSIYGDIPNDGIGTGEYVCDNPDCQSEFNLMPNGEIL